MRRLALALCALSLSGCSLLGGASSSNPFSAASNLQKFTSVDLQTALADATANNDTAGAACWTLLLQDLQKLNLQANTGIASLAQINRDMLVEGPRILSQCSGMVPMLSLP
jgi:hypothetical protein